MIVDAIVLAAGASSRMGEPKALLQVNGSTFVERAIHTLREAGCRYVVAVLNGDDDWASRLADVSGAAVVINDAVESQQIDSLRLGIANLPEDGDGVLVLPVDFPRVQVSTIKRVIDEFARGDALIVNPAYNGEAGHPVLFARSLLFELLADDLPDGARSVMAAHEREARTIPVADPGVLTDVDTPDDYQKHVQNE